MQTLIKHAAPPGPQCTLALQRLELPRLGTLLRVLNPAPPCIDGSTSLTTPFERAHARSLGLPVQDGLVPWAALEAKTLGLHGADSTGWAYITLCHWTINADHVAMPDVATLHVSQAESEALMQSMRAFFLEDGIALYPAGHGARWLASGPLFADLPTASLERATGDKVDAWLPRQPQARLLRRLQNEMQMLLYTHPVNDARSGQQLSPINSFWVSGTGCLPADCGPADPSPVHCTDALGTAALQDDAEAWLSCWQTLDQTLVADLLAKAKAGERLQLTLCGSVGSQTFSSQSHTAHSLWAQLKRRFGPINVSALLQSL